MATNYSRAPRIVMDELVYQKIMYWVNKSSYEVSGLGNVVVEEGNVLRIVDVMLCEQKNTAVTTELDGAAVGKAAFELHQSQAPGEMRFWWHSHVNMAVFWSGQDLETINALAEGGWFISTVFNKKREMRTAISMSQPFRMLYDEVTLEVERMLPADLVSSWDKEYVTKVENFAPKHIAGTGKNHKNWPNQNNPRNYNSSQTYSKNSHYQNGQRKPQRDIYPPLSQKEREEISRLAALMEDEDPQLGNHFIDGDDRLYGDLDWPGNQSSSRSSGELSKPMRNIPEVISERNRLEDRLGKYEDRLLTLDEKGKQPPEKLLRAIEEAEQDLQQIEEELDALQEAGLITEEERFEARPFN